MIAPADTKATAIAVEKKPGKKRVGSSWELVRSVETESLCVKG